MKRSVVFLQIGLTRCSILSQGQSRDKNLKGRPIAYSVILIFLNMIMIAGLTVSKISRGQWAVYYRRRSTQILRSLCHDVCVGMRVCMLAR